MPKEISNRVAVSVIVGILLALAVGYTVYTRLHAERSMTLVEALWACTPDMKTYFPPGSPESLTMVQMMSKGIDTNAFRTSHFLCMRLLVGENLSVDEPVMWEIDPKRIPDNAVERTRAGARRSP